MPTTEQSAQSFNAQVRGLNIGECVAKAERFELGTRKAGEVGESLQKLRRTVNAAVSRIRDKTGNNFRVESGSFVTDDLNAALAVVTVTRVDNDNL